MSKGLTYTNNGDGSHTVRRNGKVLGEVRHSRPWWIATAGLRGVGGLGSMTEAGERLAEWADTVEPVTPELVDIAAVYADAIKIKGSELRDTDLVFDSSGGTHRLTSVRGPLANGNMSFKRADYPHREHIGKDDPMTVVRADDTGPARAHNTFPKLAARKGVES